MPETSLTLGRAFGSSQCGGWSLTSPVQAGNAQGVRGAAGRGQAPGQGWVLVCSPRPPGRRLAAGRWPKSGGECLGAWFLTRPHSDLPSVGEGCSVEPGSPGSCPALLGDQCVSPTGWEMDTGYALKQAPHPPQEQGTAWLCPSCCSSSKGFGDFGNKLHENRGSVSSPRSRLLPLLSVLQHPLQSVPSMRLSWQSEQHPAPRTATGWEVGVGRAPGFPVSLAGLGSHPCSSRASLPPLHTLPSAQGPPWAQSLARACPALPRPCSLGAEPPPLCSWGARLAVRCRCVASLYCGIIYVQESTALQRTV